MADEQKNILKTIQLWWAKQPAQKKTFLITSAVIVAAVAAGIYMWANTPDYKPLFTDLNSTDASKIVKKLDDEKVPYKLEDNGSKILIPEKDVYKQRIKLAGAGMTLGGGVGFEMFDRMNFGMSEEERKINYQRALQTELERTIDNIGEVMKSRVHLVIPKDKVFTEESAMPKSSVYVKLKAGANLTKDQIQGIQNLIASSVERLSPDNVAVISTDGKILSDSAGSETGISDRKLQMTEKVENYYRAKIQSFLDNILGVNNSAVRVTAVLDFDKVEKAKETYIPSQAARTEQTSTQQPMDNGVAGATNAMSGGQGTRPVAVNSRNATYEVNKEVEKTVTLPGTLKQISVAVVLNGTFDAAYLGQIKESIAVASGLNVKKGDVIDVKAMVFKELVSEEERTAMDAMASREFAINLARDFLPGAVILIMALLLTFAMINAIKAAPVYMPFQGGGNESGTGGSNGNGNGHKKMDDEMILKLAKENPKEAAKILKAWIS